MIESRQKLFITLAFVFALLAILPAALLLNRIGQNEIRPTTPTDSSSSTAESPKPSVTNANQTETKGMPVSPPKEPECQPSTKQITDDKWRIDICSPKEWFDTGIPAVANSQFVIECEAGKWLTKIGGTVFLNSDDSDRVANAREVIEVTEQPTGQIRSKTKNKVIYQEGSKGLIVSPDFRSTIKFKLDDEAEAGSLSLVVKIAEMQDQVSQSEDHLALHSAARKWAEDRMDKIVRR